MSDNVAVLPSGMFWHIFRKDWRLLILLIVTNAALKSLLDVLTFHVQPYPLTGAVPMLGAVVTLCLMATMSLLIVLSVQQEALPGATQDWLIRPIRRGDLLSAKLLGIAVFVHGPIFTVELLEGVAEGFPLGSVLRATVLANFEIALLFSLPAMAIACVTRTIGEAVLGSLALLVVLLLEQLLLVGLASSFQHALRFSGPVSGTGIEWVWRFLSHAVLLLTVVATLGVQYFRRETLKSRWVLLAGMSLYLLIQDLPWGAAFAIQQAFSGNPQGGHAVSMVFAADAHQSPATANEKWSLLSNEDSRDDKGRYKATARVILPMWVSGVTGGGMLHTDRAVVRLIDSSGKLVYHGIAESVDVRASTLAGGRVLSSQPIGIPTSVYRNIAHQPLQVELEYSLTLLRSRVLPALDAVDDQRRDPDLGRCATRIDEARRAVEVGCRKSGELPFCLSLVLEAGTRRNPEKFVCELNYEPTLLRFSIEPIDHLHVKLPYHDPTGLARFPVDGSSLRQAHVAVHAYEPEDHFTRKVVIQRVTLSDWRASAAP